MEAYPTGLEAPMPLDDDAPNTAEVQKATKPKVGPNLSYFLRFGLSSLVTYSKKKKKKIVSPGG